MNIALFEDSGYRQLLPLTWLRPCFELRCGRDRLIDKIRAHVSPRLAWHWVRDELRDVAPTPGELVGIESGNWCLFSARALVTGDTAPPAAGVAWKLGGRLVAVSATAEQVRGVESSLFLDDERLHAWCAQFHTEPPPATVRLIEHPWDLVLANGDELRRQCRDGGTHDGRVYPGAHLLNPGAIRIAAGSVIKPGVVLDAEDGPIEIDREVTIAPNAVIEGPCYIGPQTIIRAGAYVRQNTTIGPVCRVGGEVEGSILHGYANKQHDGFLGHSYLGEWTNLGAGTINSDLKNTYGLIRVAINGVETDSGQRFLGATIGDHAKTGIGTILPTGCVLGVACNVFTRTALPKFVPSFAWLTDRGLDSYRVEKAVELARTVMSRRKIELSAAQQALIERTAAAARGVEAAGWA